MNIFARNRRRRLRKPCQIQLNCGFPTDVSVVTCAATNCYFNRYYKGEITCDLKEIFITKNGTCQYYRPNEENQ